MANLPFHLVYLSNWIEGDPFAHAWSLACEEQFYLVWPLIVVLLPGRRAALALAGFLVFKQVVHGLADTSVLDRDALILRIVFETRDEIAAGVLLAYILHSQRGYAILRRLIGWRWSSPCMFVATAVLLASPYHDDRPMLLPLVMAALVASCVLREDHVLRGALSWAPARRIGIVSYGMYLMHMLAISVMSRSLPESCPPGSAGRFLGAAGLSFVAASLSFRYFEGYFLRLKEKFSRPSTS